MKQNSQKVKNWRQRTKEKILNLKGNKCSICGYNKCNDALAFHHLNDKEFSLSFALRNCKSWNNILQEIDKCILVCLNCHAELHYNSSPPEI